MRYLLLSLFIIPLFVLGQTNLVDNPTFSTPPKAKVKEGGMIELAVPWTSPTIDKSDLYVPKSKSFYASVPENDYGEEKPMEGENYAGFRAYSYKGKYPRTYIQGKLTQKLEAGKKYCVTFHVSLADLSKYACNNLALAFSEKALEENNSEILSFDNYVVSRKLVTYTQQYYWTPICGEYTAKGGEEYIVIGNFVADSKLVPTPSRVKRPKGFTKPQKYDAYYYVDNVSVVPRGEVDKCDCDVTPGMENAKTVERDFTSEKNEQAKTVKIINSDGSVGGGNADGVTKGSAAAFSLEDGVILSFNPKSSDMSEEATAIADKIIEYMKTNADAKVAVTGYVDASESDVDKLDGKRANAIYKYILSKGIKKERLERELGGTDPIDEKDKLKNMRVEVSLSLME